MIDIVRSQTKKVHIVSPSRSNLWSAWRTTKCGESIHRFSGEVTREAFNEEIAAGNVCRKCLKKENAEHPLDCLLETGHDGHCLL